MRDKKARIGQGAAGRLTLVNETEIVRSITAIHHEKTGAPCHLIQVIFYAVAPDSHYLELIRTADFERNQVFAADGRLLRCGSLDPELSLLTRLSIKLSMRSIAISKCVCGLLKMNWLRAATVAGSSPAIDSSACDNATSAD